MLKPRIIPCLLIKDGGLVKTVNFSHPKYVGDPINVVKILNEKEVDELILLDISCSAFNKSINFKLIQNIASECRMPLCYGGGVSTVDDVSRLIEIGVEKVAINSAIFSDSDLLMNASSIVGSQSIVAIIDVKYLNGEYIVFKHNGLINTGFKLKEHIQYVLNQGIGELVINSIDRDGTLEGFDFKLVEIVKTLINIPLTIVGGASSHENIKMIFDQFGLIGAGVGSLFVFKGKFKAVLVNYPTGLEKKIILDKNLIDGK